MAPTEIQISNPPSRNQDESLPIINYVFILGALLFIKNVFKSIFNQESAKKFDTKSIAISILIKYP